MTETFEPVDAWDHRLALGATGAQIQMAVVSQTLRLVLAGVAIGTAASVAMARGIASLLFGTEPTDPVIFMATMAILFTVAVVAGQIPARRPSRIDPIAVLRNA